MNRTMLKALQFIAESATTLEEAKSAALAEVGRHILVPGLCICRDPDCTIPFGYCHCKCGKKTMIARQTVTREGRVRGMPQKYLSHHTGQTKERPEVLVRVVDEEELALFPLGNDNWTLIDAEDIEKTSVALWYRSTQGYAVSSDSVVGATSTRKQRLHRYLMGSPEGMDVDHVNGNCLDNRKCNLRVCTHAENLRNLKARDDLYGRYPGVTWMNRRQKWRADISIGGKRICLGEFTSYSAAVAKRQLAEVKHHGEFAYSLSRKEEEWDGTIKGFFPR